LQVVILHCHFERGGVTQVVENHVQAIRRSGVTDIVLVSGDRVSGLSASTRNSVKHLVIDGFDYDRDEAAAGEIDRRAAEITKVLVDRLGHLGIDRGDAVLHWHNHSLGKNTAAPAVIGQLATAGWKLLLQVHDFAEDNRPENYARLIRATTAKDKRQLEGYLYPVAPQIHYATLTRADARVLTSIGVPADQVSVLPNSVMLPDVATPTRDEALARVRPAMNLPSNARWCLYPVRGIRRKNVGEFVLLCRWLGENRFGGLTLCPATAVEKRSYLRWKEFAKECSPQAVFDAAHHPDVSFTDNLAASDYIVSTSVAEGFGMAYLEPWLAGRRVIARRLSTVMDDFVADGLRFPDVYDTIPIPGDRDWLTTCRIESRAAEQASWSELPELFRPAFVSDESDDDVIDFAKLIPRRQQEVLQRIHRDAGYESEIKQRSATLVKALQAEMGDESTIVHNADVIREYYSVQRQAEQLANVYAGIVDARIGSQVTAPECAGQAIDFISRVRSFFPCRTETFDEQLEQP
tara:strand:+ start:36349 stop:37911 length:1563 start_codon:yes stop_codon:yes gene_type:complete